MIHIDKQIKTITRAEKRKLVIERLKTTPELSDKNIALTLGVSGSFVWKIRQELQVEGVLKERMHTQDDSWAKHPYFLANKEKLLLNRLSEKSLRALKAEGVLDKMQEKGSLSPRYCQRLLYKEKKAANRHPSVTVTEQDVKIFQGDVRSGLPEILDNSVNLVFVDPPYNRRAVVTLYEHIADISARILVDGGSLLVMCGGSHLDLALEKLTKTNKTFKYQWNISYVCPRGTPLIQGRRVTTAVKNIIWMVKGKYTGPIQHDLVYAPPDPNQEDKTPHLWGQSVQGVKSILEKFSSSGDTICDIMCGGGSTVIAALELGSRPVIACDIELQSVNTTKKRVSKMFGAE